MHDYMTTLAQQKKRQPGQPAMAICSALNVQLIDLIIALLGNGLDERAQIFLKYKKPVNPIDHLSFNRFDHRSFTHKKAINPK